MTKGSSFGALWSIFYNKFLYAKDTTHIIRFLLYVFNCLVLLSQEIAIKLVW